MRQDAVIIPRVMKIIVKYAKPISSSSIKVYTSGVLMWLKVLSILVGSHAVRCMSEYVYYTQCAGLWTSIFSWNSPTCRGLRWVSDSAMTNVVSLIGGYSIKLMEILY
jgi:hypothetical protein